MEFKTLIYEVTDGIATVTFNRPEAMNSSNALSVAELNQAVDMIEADDSVRVAIMWEEPRYLLPGRYQVYVGGRSLGNGKIYRWCPCYA